MKRKDASSDDVDKSGKVQRSIASFFVPVSQQKSASSAAASAAQPGPASQAPAAAPPPDRPATAPAPLDQPLRAPQFQQFALQAAAPRKETNSSTQQQSSALLSCGPMTTKQQLPAAQQGGNSSVGGHAAAEQPPRIRPGGSCTEWMPRNSSHSAETAGDVEARAAAALSAANTASESALAADLLVAAASGGAQALPSELETAGVEKADAAEQGQGSSEVKEEAAQEPEETDFERARAERIRRNMEVMRSMGLGGPAVSPKRPSKKAAPPRSKAPQQQQQPTERKYPLRSRRGVGAGAAAEGAAGGAVAEGCSASAAPKPEPPLVFDDSSVLRYVCQVAQRPAEAAAGTACGDGGTGVVCRGPWRQQAPEGAQITGFAQLPGALMDSALSRAYSIDWRPGLVVAGGKDGQVSIFGSRQLEEGSAPTPGQDLPPLLSTRLHRGWISDVQFVSLAAATGILGGEEGGGSWAQGAGASGLGAGLLLLTAGNDGALCLWDVARTAAQGRGVQPQQLAKVEDLHSGGIFSMHELGGSVLTASKDCTVALSALGQEGSGGSVRLVRRYEELHEGVVKCARWRDPNTFASCGNDRSVCIVDTRQGGSDSAAAGGASLRIADAHSTAVNCLRWHPAAEHLLLTSSHDPHILLHDLRQLQQPLFTFTGHSLQKRISSIYQPAFVWGGAGVATGCEKSSTLSLYCTATGSTLSRGEVDFNIGATFCGRGRQDPLICTATRTVHMLAPTWKA